MLVQIPTCSHSWAVPVSCFHVVQQPSNLQGLTHHRLLTQTASHAWLVLRQHHSSCCHHQSLQCRWHIAPLHQQHQAPVQYASSSKGSVQQCEAKLHMRSSRDGSQLSTRAHAPVPQAPISTSMLCRLSWCHLQLARRAILCVQQPSCCGPPPCPTCTPCRHVHHTPTAQHQHAPGAVHVALLVLPCRLLLLRWLL
jgi:hypothetical protein